jgi:integrase
MARLSLKQLSRDRVLGDDEIRSVLAACEDVTPSAYGRLVRSLLLSAARLNEVAGLQWPEIEGDVAVVPPERVKTKTEHVIPVTDQLAAQIGTRIEDAGDYVFSTDGGYRQFTGYSKCKRRLDAAIKAQRKADGLKPMPEWRLHDLRRTARSLMGRAGVPADHAERVLGHALAGVRGVYDRHTYLTEKRAALDRLGTLLESIINPPPANVVNIAARR